MIVNVENPEECTEKLLEFTNEFIRSSQLYFGALEINREKLKKTL